MSSHAQPAAVATPVRYLVAAVLNWIVVLALFGIGVDYLVAREVMPHHKQILDVPWNELTERTRVLMMTMMKGTGLVGVLGAISLAILLIVPFRRRENWSRHGIMIIGCTILVPTLLATFKVEAAAGARGPWWPHVVLLSCLFSAFWLTRDFGSAGEHAS